ncbi:hypothetical protein ACFQZJ_05625 [Maribacter chungangensis]|uniref:DUF4398 domain-containing protein n=1 Tax=Maribacter chungangensis TaxID=1069117 RepID=A0ABW3B1P6_9FLAO
MNKTYIFIGAMSLVLFSSFTSNMECQYAGSNIGFAKTQTETAIAKDDINQARFYAYKALNAIEKSKKQLAICGCEYAETDLKEGLENLKMATQATSLSATRIFLERSLKFTLSGIEALESHDLHESKYGNELLAVNTVSENKPELLNKKGMTSLNKKIDLSLEKYKLSLEKIVETVSCKEARAFAERIFENCEKELLKTDLSEGKKYYNLRTKEITADALLRIPDCL